MSTASAHSRNLETGTGTVATASRAVSQGKNSPHFAQNGVRPDSVLRTWSFRSLVLGAARRAVVWGAIRPTLPASDTFLPHRNARIAVGTGRAKHHHTRLRRDPPTPSTTYGQRASTRSSGLAFGSHRSSSTPTGTSAARARRGER